MDSPKLQPRQYSYSSIGQQTRDTTAEHTLSSAVSPVLSHAQSTPIEEVCDEILCEITRQQVKCEETVFRQIYKQTQHGKEYGTLTFENFDDWMLARYKKGFARIEGPTVGSTRSVIHDALRTPVQDSNGIFALYGSQSLEINIGKGKDKHYRISFMSNTDFWSPSNSKAWLAPDETTEQSEYILDNGREALERPFFLLGDPAPCFFGLQIGFLQYCTSPETDEWVMSDIVCALGGPIRSVHFQGVFLVNPSAVEGHDVELSSKHEILNGDLAFESTTSLEEKEAMDEAIRNDVGIGNAAFALLGETLDGVDENYTISLKQLHQNRMTVYKTYYDKENGKLCALGLP